MKKISYNEDIVVIDTDNYDCDFTTAEKVGKTLTVSELIEELQDLADDEDCPVYLMNGNKLCAIHFDSVDGYDSKHFYIGDEDEDD